MKKNSFVEGTFIATFAIIIVKILGVLYVIPFYRIIGESGGSLYSYAYNVYNLFLNISTAGIPIAISKIITEYNTLEMYEAKERSYKVGRNIILMLSVLAFFVLFVFSCCWIDYQISTRFTSIIINMNARDTFFFNLFYQLIKHPTRYFFKHCFSFHNYTSLKICLCSH